MNDLNDANPFLDDIEGFRAHARDFISANLSHVGTLKVSLESREDEEELALVARDREVQRILFDGGLAGVCVPREYGGQGLTKAHQEVLCEELRGYEYPTHLQAPTMSPCMAVLLDFGNEDQKKEHVPKILTGEEIWMQFLSEPGNGSDLAGVTTTAVRDGDEWVLNGSKVWTTGAWWSDWGLCLARTNWDVPKHRGMTVFMLPITAEGIEVQRIEMLNGNSEFCQEFFTDVRIPDSARIGEVDEGWTVVTRWLFHERMLYNSPYVTVPAGTTRSGEASSALHLLDATGRTDDVIARDLVGEVLTLNLVSSALSRRVAAGIVSGQLPDQSAAVAKLFIGVAGTRAHTIEFELGGGLSVAWDDDLDGDAAGLGDAFLMRQVSCIGGGTTEMAANVVAERLLGMPRERTVDRDTPFRDVPRSAT